MRNFVFALDHPYDAAFVRLDGGTVLTFANRHKPGGPPSAAGFRIDAEREAVWVRDTEFAVEQVRQLNNSGSPFHNRLKLDALGLFCHSMGGRVAIRACQVLTDVRGCLNEDGGLFGVDFHSNEVVPFVDKTVIRASLLNIDVSLRAPGQLDAEAQKGFANWQTTKHICLRPF
jgi:hypothetical protein